MFKRKPPWKAFFIVYLLLAILPVSALTAYASWWVSFRYEEIQRRATFAVQLESEAVFRGLDQVAADICTLAVQNELTAFLDDGDPRALDAMAREYLTLARNVPAYDQIRFIDKTGQERVRVDQDDEKPSIVSGDVLQDKSGRYYFSDAFIYGGGQIYVSPLDLNIESGEIERPHKPMVRIGTPVVDSAGRKQGLVLINVRAQTMLDEILAVGGLDSGEAMLLNADGYWLVARDPDLRWGFMVPDRAEARMPSSHPAAWSAMNRAESGAIRTKEGLFAFQAVYPLQDIGSCYGAGPRADLGGRDSEYRWIVANHVPEESMVQVRNTILMRAVAWAIPLLLLLGLATWMATVALEERQKYRGHLKALVRFDTLTGLANRRAFEERVEHEIQRSQRHGRQFAVLYLDLDGFRGINDQYGYAAGDQVLIDVANSLTQSCRSIDVVARYGGDEFVVLLSEVLDPGAGVAVAEKMLSGIQAMTWNGDRIGASIGVAFWPQDVRDAPTLIRLADEAMHAAKGAGKNCVKTARDVRSPSRAGA